MNEFPIIFTFNEVIIVKKGLKAYVSVIKGKGQALLIKENNKYWLNGAHPGGMSDGGNTLKEALHNFKIAFRNVLSDIEGDSRNYEDFQNKVSDFFNDVDEEELKRWEEARQELKAGKVSTPEDISILKKETNEFNSFINITLIAKFIRLKSYNNDTITDEIKQENSNSQNEFLAAA
ncbi:MAG: hypothetical protein ACYCT7_09330 [bacterium]